MASATIDVGTAAPAIRLKNTIGEMVTLGGLKGQWVILYFYPKDDTPGCTREACSFRDLRNDFATRNAVIVGVSPDDAGSHQQFTKKFKLSFDLLCDTEHKVSTAYGVYKEKHNYGRTYMGIERTTFIIDDAGTVAHIFPRVKVDGHIEQVLAKLDELQSS
jgi:thioredoxin-dependent peroxiredoxin